MKLFFFLLLFCFECQANGSLKISNAELKDSLQKMAAHKGKLVKEILYMTVEYCSNEFPDAKKVYLESKENWDNANSPFITGSQPILHSWLLKSGIDQEEIAVFTKAILDNQKKYSQEKVAADLFLKLSSKTKVKQRKNCDSTIKAFSSGRFNLPFLVISDYQAMKDAFQTFPTEFHRQKEDSK